MKKRSGNQYRYRVVTTWGNAPVTVTEIIDKPDAYLVYGEYLGPTKTETLVNLADGKVTGGWTMRYMGMRPA